MKFLVAAVAFLASNTVAFAPAAFGRPSFQLQATVRPDTSQYVKQALEAVEKYGATSKEARLAWETVEEMDASNRQNNAMAKGLSPEECDVDEPSPECLEYNEKLDQLAKLIEATGGNMARVKGIAEEIKAIKMTNVEMPKGEASPAVRAALENAKKVSAEKGADSSEAKLAWEELEEIASASEKAGALGARLDDECLTEMIEACDALEELSRVLNLKGSGDRYSG